MMTGASIRFPHLGIVIEHLGKSISIFGFDIAYYGIIIGVGMLCGIAMAVHEAKRTGQNPEMYYDFALCAIISAIVGCRIYYVAFEWSYYSQHPLEIFNLRQGGLAIYGGIIGGFICMIIFSKIRKASLLLMADTVVPGLLSGRSSADGAISLTEKLSAVILTVCWLCRSEWMRLLIRPRIF